MSAITEFNGEYSWLSNMTMIVPFVEDGIQYNSVETYYQAHKTTNQGIKLKISNMQPHASKKYGKLIPIRPDWEDIKVDVMRRALKIKFSQEKMLNELANTGTRELIEGNTWNDTFWGVCKRTGKGQNKLGQLLVEIRTEIFERLEKNKYLIDDYPAFDKLFNLYDYGYMDSAVVKVLKHKMLKQFNEVQLKMLASEIEKVDVEQLEILTKNDERVEYVTASPALRKFVIDFTKIMSMPKIFVKVSNELN